MEGSDTAGTYLEAGLPNIIGGHLVVGTSNSAAECSEGTFRGSGGAGYAEYANGKARYYDNWIYFNASWYNPIYKDDCNTVQPSAYTVQYYIRAK